MRFFVLLSFFILINKSCNEKVYTDSELEDIYSNFIKDYKAEQPFYALEIIEKVKIDVGLYRKEYLKAIKKNNNCKKTSSLLFLQNLEFDENSDVLVRFSRPMKVTENELLIYCSYLLTNKNETNLNFRGGREFIAVLQLKNNKWTKIKEIGTIDY